MQAMQFSILTFIFGAFMFLPNTFAQDYTRWGLPEGAKVRLGKGRISGNIVYSPDGTRLAVASSIGIWLYDTGTYQEVALLTGHTDSVSSVAFRMVARSPVEVVGRPICGMSPQVNISGRSPGIHLLLIASRSARMVVRSPVGVVVGRSVCGMLSQVNTSGRSPGINLLLIASRSVLMGERWQV